MWSEAAHLGVKKEKELAASWAGLASDFF